MSSEVNRKPREERRFEGIPVAPGIARGQVFVHWGDDEEIPIRTIRDEDVPGEITRFESALIATRAELLDIQKRIAEGIGSKDASLFDAHLLVVEDRTLIDEVLRTVQREKHNVEYVFHQVAERYCKTLGQIEDDYLRERVVDIEDVARRVLRHLLGRAPRTLTDEDKPHILVAHEITPSDTALMNRDLVLGFATEAGSKTSHTAIMARSMNIPAIVGLHGICETLTSGQEVLLDGYHGLLILDPSEETLQEYGRIETKIEAVEEKLELIRDTACATKDGRRIILSANIELPDELPDVQDCGAEGIGLYRTEFLYLNRRRPPTEEEQYENYRLVAERCQPHGVIIRTLDIGGDKPIESLELSVEQNPFLGCRAIRYCLDNPDVFKPQLRAILRAAHELQNVRLMYPMISGLEELRRANALLEECKQSLTRDGLPFAADLEVGIMVEIPSAALAAEILAPHVRFFSIGTNDLIQYTIAVDRGNDRIAHLYEPTHPGVLRLLKMIVDAAHQHGIWAGICGEMAGDIHLTPLLVGLGIDELSAGTAAVPRVKKAVQSMDYEACRQFANELLQIGESQKALVRCQEMALAHYGELFA